MIKGRKIQELIEYVQRREQLPDFLGVLQKQRPEQYAKRLGQANEILQFAHMPSPEGALAAKLRQFGNIDCMPVSSGKFGMGSKDESASGSRVLRGGSFDYGQRSARCGYRYYNFPDFRSSDYGFRVVVSPALSG